MTNRADVTDVSTLRVVGIFISPGHNFFGHHEQPAGTHPTISVSEIDCVAGKGLFGDRFFGFKENYKGQVTFFSSEVFADVCRKLNVVGKSPGVARRNVVTRGVDLNSLVGKRFVIQGIEFEGVCECSPCHWMNHAIGEGAERALRGRGGLRARILSDGVLRVDGVMASDGASRTDATHGTLV
ncbi:MAG TPA: molybdenum cofactor biosysynthesis protein [Verrucomicrobiae bacterium]|nr:molybdenum cofactor biosysynthesis protein [Verrucomicrobiae bacterium]